MSSLLPSLQVHNARTAPQTLVVLLWLAFGGANLLLSFISPAPLQDLPKLLATTAGGITLSLLLAISTPHLMSRRGLSGWSLLAGLVLLSASLLWVLDTAVQYWSVHGSPFRFIPISLLEPYRYNWVYFVAIFSLQTAALAFLASNRTIEARERQLAEARLATQQAKFAALQFQLNPHFLFNTLNAISTLVTEAGARDAELMIARLSDFLRATLATEPGELTTLDSELERVQAYLDIESVRFGDRLDVHYSCEANLSAALVPALILQPLLENAIKYAVAPSKRPVAIMVEARRSDTQLILIVEDDGTTVPESSHKHGAGLGLKNVAGRLDALFAAGASLEVTQRDRGFLAIVRMPIQLSSSGATQP